MATQEKVTGSSLTARSAQELQALLVGKREDLRKAMFKQACRELKQTHSLGQLRRDVARLCTVLAHKAAQESSPQ